MSVFSSAGQSDFRSSNSSAGSEFDFELGDFSDQPTVLNNLAIPQAHPRFDIPAAGPILYPQHRTPLQFQSPTQYAFNSPTMPNLGPSLNEVFKYPVVQQLYNDLNQANRRVSEALEASARLQGRIDQVLETQSHLQQEVLRLTSIIQSDPAARFASPSYK